MKKLLKSIPTLHIVIDITDSESGVAASVDFKELKHPSGKKKYRRSDEWLDQVNDLVRSIIGSMQGRKFKILDAKPSNKSYTYYIRFQPADRDGNLWDQELEIQVELRDHRSKTHEDSGFISSKLLVKAFYLDNNLMANGYELMKEMWAIMDQLSEGDFSAFF